MVNAIGQLVSITGSLGLFLYGMKVMSDGIQAAAGSRFQRALNFMTGNRFMGVATGVIVTAIIQSSSATTVMAVSFVNAGLLTLTQSIGVIMGANIGTTITAWIVSLIGFSLKLSTLALPAVGFGFIMLVVKWKRRELGTVLLGFGLLFMGLDFLTKSMPALQPETFGFIRSSVGDAGFLTILAGTGIGLLITLITHSSSASTAIMLTMAHQNLITYNFAAAMILGANIGTTIDAALASIGAKTAARRAALVHVLFNVIGTLWALALFKPLLMAVSWVTPGSLNAGGITNHLAMFHTLFNVINTLLFFPFVKPFANLVSLLIKDSPGAKPADRRPYKLAYQSGAIQDTPELNIIRAEKEIRDMAGIAASMYEGIGYTLKNLKEAGDKTGLVDGLVQELTEKEALADEMREQLTLFLMECAGQKLNVRSERNVSLLLRIVMDLENMTDDCHGAALLLERSVKKEQGFKGKEMRALTAYVGLVEVFLAFVMEHLGQKLTWEQVRHGEELKRRIDKGRNELRKLSRKRIAAGENVKIELLFIDLVRRIEKLGDNFYGLFESLRRIA
ncbi:MAG: Na/Pi cotransporter family protein [Treponema sp.]|jgi:phosphate:Na+ symporter|nr:Na/Pi cotransporter family protein [Treponema sp.]